MIGDAIIIGLLTGIMFTLWKLIEQIEELRECQNKLFTRIAINEIQRNTAPARNKGGDTK